MSAMKAALINATLAAEVQCPYCRAPARLVEGDVIYPHLPWLHDKKFWMCEPCDAYVGCHRPKVGYGDGTRPLGRLANAGLRKAKRAAHAVFDPLWEEGYFHNRKATYAWLAGEMGLQEGSAHIGEFDEEQCAAVINVCREKLRGGRWPKS